ncbi:MAG: sulfatase-like hydrolase/transferase [bacterium]|nr:sulfatase-like hydrolase/transferase [bacterium]
MTILLPQENEVVNLLKQFRREKHEILQVYYKNYQASISKNRNYSQIKQLVTPSDNIFMIHLESYNAEFSNEKISPNLINIAKTQGIFFPRIQASAVLTIRSQEVLLCGILPSLGQNLSKGNTLTRDLRCIPKILKENGYKTMYFKSHSNLEFANTANFMKNIGFDEIHSKDIMKSTDRELSWGYPEDIFYARVFEYLKKHQQEKIFAYIAVSSTNHFPFYNDEKKIAFPQFANLIPYPNPITTREKIADTTYIQDNFFGKMFTELFKPTFGNNSHLVVYGDHSWPIEIHPGNKFNENEAYQENFVSSFGIVPATSKSKQFAMGKVVSNLYSHLDIPLTILDLAGIHGYQLSGHSFFNELTTNSTEITRNSHCLVSVQPFADKYIATVQYPIKLIYNTTKNTVTEYNIQEDPHEKKSTEEHIIKEGDIISLQNCLQENNT